MDSSQKRLPATAADWFRSTSRGSRAAMVFILMLVSVVLINSSGWKNECARCSLLGSSQLTQTELDRIEIALGKSGFGDFESGDGVILVPENQRAELLKTLAEENALPARFQQEDSAGPNLNPFYSHGQQAALERRARKKQIETMLARLPFVDQAWFEMDSAKSKTAFQAPRYSAVVSVQPAHRQSLNGNQVMTIRQIVSGAFAAMEPNDIVVTDLNAGRAFHQTAISAMSSLEQVDQWEMIAANRQSHYEDAIRRALAEFPGVTFELQYDLDTEKLLEKIRLADAEHRVADSGSQTIQQQVYLEPVRADSTPTVTTAGFATNGQAEIDTTQREIPNAKAGNQQGSSMPMLRSNNQMPQMIHSENRTRIARLARKPATYIGAERVSVLVRVPGKLLSDNSQMLDGPGSRKHIDPQVVFESLKTRIVERLRPVLPISNLDMAANPIVVSLEKSDAADRDLPTMAAAQKWVTENWASLCVVLIGAMLLVVVTRSGPTAVKPTEAHRLMLDSNPGADDVDDDELEVEEKRAAEQRLARMIESDPDAAARVIKNWIRDAA